MFLNLWMSEELARIFRLINDPLNILTELFEVLFLKTAQMITYKTTHFQGCHLHTIVETESDEVYNSLMSDHLS